MSTNVRKQLGPAKKRLIDRIKEAQVVLEEEDIRNLNTVNCKYQDLWNVSGEVNCRCRNVPKREGENWKWIS